MNSRPCIVLLFLCASLAPATVAVREVVLLEANPDIVSRVVASPDAQRLAWVETTEGRERAVLAGAPGPYYKAVSNIAFSEDGSHIAYVVQTDGPAVPGVDQAVVFDNELGELFEHVSFPQMDLHGRLLAYFAESKPAPVMLVVNGSFRRPGDTIIEGSLVLSREGGRFAFIVKQKDLYHLATDAGLLGSYKSMALSNVTFSPDGEHLSYTVDAAEPVFILDGNLVGYYDEVLGPVYDSVGKGLGYALRYRDLWQVTIQRPGRTMQFETTDEISDLMFCPSGEHFAYTKTRPLGGTTVMLDTVPVGEYHEVEGLTFSPDGKHLAFAAAEGTRWRVVFKGVASGLYGSVRQLVVSPGGEHWACWEDREDGEDRARAIVDGVKGKDYDATLSRIVFDSEHQLHYVARRRNTYYRVTVSFDK